MARILGVDPSFRGRDRFGIVVVDYTPTKNSNDTPEMTIVAADFLRQDLKTPEVVERLAELVSTLGPDAIAIDAGGGGQSIVDLMVYELRKVRNDKKTKIIAIKTLASGRKGKTKRSGGAVNTTVPKDELLSRVLIAIEQQRIKYGQSVRRSAELHKQLTGLKVAIKNDTIIFGNDVGTDRTVAHDDLSIAAALAVYTACQGSIKKATLASPVSAYRNAKVAGGLSKEEQEFIDGSTADAMVRNRNAQAGWGRGSRGAGIYSVDIGGKGYPPSDNTIQDGQWPDRRH